MYSFLFCNILYYVPTSSLNIYCMCMLSSCGRTCCQYLVGPDQLGLVG